MSRCDSAAMVPKTSDDLPDPETPVNTVSRRLGISTLMSLRLFSRAPWTRMRSWLSAGGWLEAGMGSACLALGARCLLARVQRHGRADERREGPHVDLIALGDVDGSSRAAP